MNVKNSAIVAEQLYFLVRKLSQHISDYRHNKISFAFDSLHVVILQLAQLDYIADFQLAKTRRQA